MGNEEVFHEKTTYLQHVWHQNHLQTSQVIHRGTAIRRFQNDFLVTSAILPQNPPFDPFPAPSPELVPFLNVIAETAYFASPQVRSLKIEHLSRSREIDLKTPEGFRGHYFHTFNELRLTLNCRVHNALCTGHATNGSSSQDTFFEPSVDHLVQAALTNALHQTTAEVPARGEMPVVMSSGWNGIWLHEAIGHPSEADVWQQYPFLGDPDGRKIAPETVNVIDHPTLEGARVFLPFDDEGSQTNPVFLIRSGCFEGLLTDRKTAFQTKRLGMARARRSSFLHPPMPRMSNLCLLPGDNAPRDLLMGIREGIYVQTAGTAVFNPKRRMVQVFVKTGFKIQDGKLTTPLAGFWVGGPPHKMLRAIEALGNDFKLETGRGHCEKKEQIVPISVGQPSVRFSSLWVGP
ncbi:MAG: TldD/PmbA family protein [Bacteroidetes Order II. Incertae sedis bacterium]|nr:TldD/PmbA family protein [Bacteroidetes Order II. bacterium]